MYLSLHSYCNGVLTLSGIISSDWKAELFNKIATHGFCLICRDKNSVTKGLSVRAGDSGKTIPVEVHVHVPLCLITYRIISNRLH